MLRDKSLIPLSHQHQHALALCVRIDRASPIAESDCAAWQKEISEIFQTEIGIHFAAEEKVVFPAAHKYKDLASLIEELRADHIWLRERFAEAERGAMSAKVVSTLAHRLSAHIRKEERQLFERLQESMNQEELTILGRDLEQALKAVAQTCILPSETTRLRPRK